MLKEKKEKKIEPFGAVWLQFSLCSNLLVKYSSINMETLNFKKVSDFYIKERKTEKKNRNLDY